VIQLPNVLGKEGAIASKVRRPGNNIQNEILGPPPCPDLVAYGDLSQNSIKPWNIRINTESGTVTRWARL
jgi:hypothetical protein